MKPGDLAVVVQNDLIWNARSGGNPLGAARRGEIVTTLSDVMSTDGVVEILHPTVGVGFINRCRLNAVNETR